MFSKKNKKKIPIIIIHIVCLSVYYYHYIKKNKIILQFLRGGDAGHFDVGQYISEIFKGVTVRVLLQLNSDLAGDVLINFG